jgi:two-component system OmpR family response regulator
MASPAIRSIATAILLADDDIQLANFLSKSLESEGYAVHTAVNEVSVLEELRRQNYQLIILDLNFGQTDGLQLLERLRAQGLETPVIVLSARDRVADRIQSLNLGADDYVTKPFSFQELAARANALLRRKADPALNVLRIENLELDPASRKVHRGNRDIKLSPREFDLLHLLMHRGGDTVSRSELLRECWGQESETDSNLVDVYVNYLRRKIDVAEEEKLIFTVRGSGYRLGKAALDHGSEFADSPENVRSSSAHHPLSPQSLAPTEAITVQQTPLRALIHSMAHDLAQPLTSVRCFLEMAALRGGTVPSDDKDLKTIEQQADRAVGLTKGISALVREVALPNDPWVSLDSLLNDVFNDFMVLQNAGLLLLDRQWDPSIQVTSTPVLRQLCIFIISKLTGKNTSPFTLTISAKQAAGRCDVSLSWKASGPPPGQAPTAKNVINETLPYVQEIAFSLGGEISVPADQAEIILRVPAGPATTGTRQSMVH